MQFKFYSLATGDFVATVDVEDPMDAYRRRVVLQRERGEALGSLVPLNDEVDQAHVRLMVDRYRTQQAEGIA